MRSKFQSTGVYHISKLVNYLCHELAFLQDQHERSVNRGEPFQSSMLDVFCEVHEKIMVPSKYTKANYRLVDERIPVMVRKWVRGVLQKQTACSRIGESRGVRRMQFCCHLHLFHSFAEVMVRTSSRKHWWIWDGIDTLFHSQNGLIVASFPVFTLPSSHRV